MAKAFLCIADAGKPGPVLVTSRRCSGVFNDQNLVQKKVHRLAGYHPEEHQAEQMSPPPD
jgi:hypothetical protein